MAQQAKNKLNLRLEIINNSFDKNRDKINAPGLFHGKMGLAMYFYHQLRYSGLKEFETVADELIDQVYESIGSNLFSVDFEHGLAGIGWGIEYLVQNGFLEADTDDILDDIDNKVFQHVVHVEEFGVGLSNGLLGYATYIIWRLKSSGNPDVKYILERLLIEIINKMALLIDKQTIKITEPSGFDSLWDLPLLLLLLGETLELNIYNSKIHRILDDLTPAVCSLFPKLHSNRVYLLLGISSLIQQLKLPDWEKHARLLSDNICIETIIKEEFSNKSIFFKKGLAGIALVIISLAEYVQEIDKQFNSEDWTAKVGNSVIWDDVQKLEKISPNMIGLINGLAGVGLSLMELEPKKEFAS